MSHIPIEVVVFFVSLCAFIIGQISGGGAALIYTPVVIFLGIDPRIAIASGKMASFGGISGVYKFHKEKRIVWKHIPTFVILSLVAAFLGSRLLIHVDSDLASKIFGVLILLLLPLVLVRPKWGLEHIPHLKSRSTNNLGFVAYFIIAVVQAGFGGVGLLVSYTLVSFFGYTLIQANATRRFPLLFLNISAFFSYALSGLVDYSIGIAFFLASIVGSYVGAHIAVKKGNAVVKVFFLVLILISAAKLFFF
ncbi:sulfite exporter TauE/SafE family protein [Candidatus Nomurabacteria bacterium]|nr:sulfite exporter TauE/SafE family protein [Candidatus Nomurabacteria bacterium]